MVSSISNPLHLAAGLGLALGLFSAASPAWASCDDLLPASGDRPSAARLVTSDDILRLREIGNPDTADTRQQTPLAISPDHTHLALILSRADPDSNSYCRALVIINLVGPPNARVLNRGGEPIIMSVSLRGLLTQSGYPDIITPAWSPDGKWIAFLRRDRGLTQVWRVRADRDERGKPEEGEQGAEIVTRSEVDIARFVWSKDSQRLIYGATPAILDAEKAIDLEGRTGWLNDRRMYTPFSARPMVSGSLPQQVFTVDPETKAATDATPDEQKLFEVGLENSPAAYAANGLHVWTEPTTANPRSQPRLVIEDHDGKRIACSGQDCSGYVYNLWWTQDGRSLIILRREGWNKGQMGLLRWVPATNTFHRILLTDDVLRGCLPNGEALICASESSLVPRHLVEIDLHSGRQKVIYDPNPEFHTLRLGTVTRLTWTNDIGLPAWGDLVLPPDYKPGAKLPLIITQYHSDGFLRGGTGNEYPVYAFAARGFAVLSLEQPPYYGSDNPALHSNDAIEKAGIRDWNERRSVFSSLMTGVKAVLARGIVDPARIGITGMSDAASTTRFALVNSRLFAAAAISTCCSDTDAMMNAGGIAFADDERASGYPPTIDHDYAFWAPYSMSLSAKRMDRPLLMQLADREMQISLETFMALREAGQPVEMYVYPDEYHTKWQPVHRQAIYNRNLDWFDFWLKGVEDPDPAKRAQYERWEKLRAAAAEKSGH